MIVNCDLFSIQVDTQHGITSCILHVADPSTFKLDSLLVTRPTAKKTSTTLISAAHFGKHDIPYGCVLSDSVELESRFAGVELKRELEEEPELIIIEEEELDPESYGVLEGEEEEEDDDEALEMKEIGLFESRLGSLQTILDLSVS